MKRHGVSGRGGENPKGFSPPLLFPFLHTALHTHSRRLPSACSLLRFWRWRTERLRGAPHAAAPYSVEGLGCVHSRLIPCERPDKYEPENREYNRPDYAQNVSSAVHLGAYRLDTCTPLTPTQVT